MADFNYIAKKWQNRWEDNKIFKATIDKNKKKAYILEMYPFPSSSMLHVGHVRNYSIGDVIARFKRMMGFNVLYPMGYDSFGLPAENAAKKAKIHPLEYTEAAIEKIMDYQKKLGLSYDWDRVIASHRPEYYKWNQYFFIKFFEKGLAYRKKASVNYCNHCKTVLANEEVENGKCWRCENEVVQKELDQWFLKTTAYADELLNDLEKLHWPEKLKTIQQNWIGKSHGIFINFRLENGEIFPIFTTRPDTIYGVTFMVIALNHPKLKFLIKDTPYEKTVNDFIADSKKAEVAEDKIFLEKSGVFTGLYAINPLNNEKVPIYAGNFVVADYATGMIMAVPAHDQRDYEFAKEYNIPIKTVIKSNNQNCIIVHESNSTERAAKEGEPENFRHWKPWLKKELEKNGIETSNDLYPEDWAPEYDKWKEIFDKKNINENTILVGHSAGTAFLLRWLSENKRKIDKLILIAPSIVKTEKYQRISKLKDFKYDSTLKKYFNQIIIFYSDDDEHIIESAKQIHKILGGDIVYIKGMGHFCFNDMGTEKFPELLRKILENNKANIGEGVLINSESFNSLNNVEAIEKISNHIEKHNLGKRVVQYKLKDWLISRQRYWGTPIPIVYCEKCGAVALSEKDLPLLLPEDVDFSSLSNPILTSKSFMYAKCPKCLGNAIRETDTMGGFMDSSWYFLRYCSPNEKDFAFDRDAVNYWMPVDQYVGGIEHAVGHLIYSRWFVKVLRDMKMLSIDEPFNALFNQGVVYKDGHKMSKSYGNIVTQDEISEKYGIDTARIFMLFIAAPDKEMEWSDKGVEGSYKMLCRIYKLYEDYDRINSFSTYKDKYIISKKNLTIKNITNSINDFKLNNAIVQLMDFVNYITENQCSVSKEVLIDTLKDTALLLNPFAPHVSEECWEMINKKEINKDFASISSWPEYRDELINMEIHYAEEYVENIKNDIKSVLELAKIQNPSSIEIIISDKWKYELYKNVKDIMSRMNTKNNSEIIKEIMKSELKKHGQDIMKIIPKIVEKMPEYILDQESEKEAIENYDLEKIFKCEIKIIFSEDSKENKARQAMPGKPAIIVR